MKERFKDMTSSSNLKFQLLPDFAAFILSAQLKPFVEAQLQIARQMDLPMLRSILQLSDEQLVENGLPDARAFLEYLADNNYYAFVQLSNEEWMKDELKYAGKYDVVAEDITHGVFLRNKALKRFIPAYLNDITQAFALADEIDNMTVTELTLGTNTLLDLLKDRIEREAYFARRLISATPGIIFIYNFKDKRIAYLNQNIKELLGLKMLQIEQITTETLPQYVHLDDLPYLLLHFQEIYNGEENKTFQHEYRLKHADGSYLWVRNYEVVFRRDEQGKPLEILGETFDITKEKEVALALSRRDEQLTEAQNIAGMGSFEWHFSNNTRSAISEQVYKIFEYDLGNAFGDFIDHVHPDDQEKVRTAFEESLETGNYECEYRYIAKNHEKYLWAKGIVLFENEVPVKMIGTVQDITERRKMEETLLQKTIELQKTNADLSEFTYVASHDLKEPLRKISVFADMIYATEFERLSEAGQAQLKKIVDSSLRMRNLIDDILMLSSVSANRAREWVSLQAILEDVCGMLDHTIRQKQAVIESDGLPEAYVIPVLFNQLFLNLIGNSLKFSKKDISPAIEITHTYLTRHKIVTGNEANAFYLQIRIKDNGIGFSNESSDKIFHLFGRLHAVTDYEGTGLGLSICKRIVEEHGGTIQAHSTPGLGATFTVVIPVGERI